MYQVVDLVSSLGTRTVGFFGKATCQIFLVHASNLEPVNIGQLPLASNMARQVLAFCGFKCRARKFLDS